MRPEELYGILHRKPFQPFRVHVTDGRVYDIRYPKISMVGTTFFMIGIPDSDEPEDLADHWDMVDLPMISLIEPLEAHSPTLT